CAPSRAMLMTGFHNGHTQMDRNGNIGAGFRAADVTVAEMLQPAGYTTGVFGKWGFGGSGGTQTSGDKTDDLRLNPTVNTPATLPHNQGFDEFYGYLNHGRAHRYFISSLWERDSGAPNGVSEVLTGNVGPGNTNLHAANTHDLSAARGELFIRNHAQDTDPFYLQMNYTIPHNDIDWIREVPNGQDPYTSEAWSDLQKDYAAMITRMDTAVGDLLQALDDEGIRDETLILFTSDNGATPELGGSTNGGGGAPGSQSGAHPVNFHDAGGPFRGGKRDLLEGGIHMPMFAYWVDDQGVSRLDSSSTGLVTDLADFMPTVAELAGVDAPVGTDGVSILPTLTGEGIQRDRGALVFEHYENDSGLPGTPGGVRARWAIIQDGQKLIMYVNDSNQSVQSFELYNLNNDPNETTNLLAGSPSQAILDLRDELRDTALAEGVEQSDNYAVQYMNWTGGGGDNLDNATHWTGSTTGIPDDNWSAVVNNPSSADRVAETVVEDITVLGLEVRGDSGKQTVRANRGITISGRNEVRVASGGRLNLDQGNLVTNRWVDVKAGGELTGHGNVTGNVYNSGTIAPGLPTDLGQPVAQPSPPTGVNTGVVAAVVFDFTGLQDGKPNSFVGTNNGVPLTQTSTLSQWVTLTQGLDFAGATSPRHTTKPGSTDADDEFNVKGWGTGTSLTAAINGSRYVSFAVDPVFGIEMLVDSVSFNIWRNGPGAPNDYAIMTSLDGFSAGNQLGIFGPFNDDGIANDHLLTGNYTGGVWTTGEVEFRLYGWNANTTSSNTHINAVSLNASFRTVAGAGDPDVTLDPTGILALDGNLWHVAGAMIEMQLGGTNNSDPLNPQYDALQITGNLDLAGALSISLVDSFVPSLGDTFDILDFAAVTGAFESIALPSLPGILAWDTSNLLTTGVLAVTDVDRDNDGDVDGADFLDIQRTNPSLISAWRTHYGTGVLAAASAAAVPEPSSVVLCFIGTTILLLRKHSICKKLPGELEA
ncbi:MAG: sulfatase-like hydrolase/transferase, partial [Pirellulales bacterium]|nr:sulfatase-like hydrolase/transferase [Pirellulales bacterium]